MAISASEAYISSVHGKSKTKTQVVHTYLQNVVEQMVDRIIYCT